MYDIYQQSALGVKNCKVNSLSEAAKGTLVLKEQSWQVTNVLN